MQRLADELLSSGADPSTIREALEPLQVICRRARHRERIASPAEASALIAALPPRGPRALGLRVPCGPTPRCRRVAPAVVNVPIVAALRDLLVEHKLATTARPRPRLRLERDAAVHADGGSQACSTAWRRVGVDPIGLHECRHLASLIAAGVNAKAVTAYLGHASIKTTVAHLDR